MRRPDDHRAAVSSIVIAALDRLVRPLPRDRRAHDKRGEPTMSFVSRCPSPSLSELLCDCLAQGIDSRED